MLYSLDRRFCALRAAAAAALTLCACAGAPSHAADSSAQTAPAKQEAPPSTPAADDPIARDPAATPAPILPPAELARAEAARPRGGRRFGYRAYAREPDSWFASAEGLKIAENVLSYQQPSGGWPKNENMAGAPADPKKNYTPTIDNGSTYPQMQYMARTYNATKDEKWKASFDKGLDYLIEAQYPNGGWPQFYPLREGYYTHITFNDDAMIGVMNVFHDIVDNPMFAFVDEAHRESCRKALAKGLDCILKCQIKVDGKRTVWCQQHDEVTLAPAKARAYELPSFSGQESAGIVLYLMSLPNPSADVREAIEGAVAWFEEKKIEGIRIQNVDRNRVVVQDPSAPPIWARYYDLETGKPYFCGRDGVKKATMAEIEAERRNNYGWYGYNPQAVLDAYPDWKKRNP